MAKENQNTPKLGSVTDVQTAFEHAVSKGATAVVAPVDEPWGQTISYVRDLNGFLVEICSAVSG